ncbi:MAG: hypothetical protein PHY12_05165 [Eubacteriales bacterium]|nr:hypothetical protein [Eubacteriales bacterium]
MKKIFKMKRSGAAEECAARRRKTKDWNGRAALQISARLKGESR